MQLIKCGCLILFLAGCSTTYKSDGLGGGFSDSQLARDKFVVNFRGNGYTSSSKTRDLAILRGAELALQNGYPYFIVMSGGTRTKSKDIELIGGSSESIGNYYGNAVTNMQRNQYNTRYSGFGNTKTTFNSPLTTTISRHNSQFVIKGFTIETTPSNALIAEDVIKSIKSKYNIK